MKNTFLLLLLSLVIPVFGWSESHKTISVYYPSPYGEYEELRTYKLSVGSSLMGEALEDGVIVLQKEIFFKDITSNVARVTFDPTDGSLYITATGKVVIGDPARAAVTIDPSNGKVTVTGNLEVTGNGTVAGHLQVNTLTIQDRVKGNLRVENNLTVDHDLRVNGRIYYCGG